VVIVFIYPSLFLSAVKCVNQGLSATRNSALEGSSMELSYCLGITAFLVFLATGIQAFEVRFRTTISRGLVIAACAVFSQGLLVLLAPDQGCRLWRGLGTPASIADRCAMSEDVKIAKTDVPVRLIRQANLNRVCAEGGDSFLLRRFDIATAVYDIAAHTVYLPNGGGLEAHSGLGARLDDPRYVHEPMRGATPPSTYAITLRENAFHGVRALRLIPVDDANTFGRTGLLAHTYMLGPKGDSNGCVVFKDYAAFLHAFESGEIKRLVVVAQLD
jgi:hypothetical protein